MLPTKLNDRELGDAITRLGKGKVEVRPADRSSDGMLSDPMQSSWGQMTLGGLSLATLGAMATAGAGVIGAPLSIPMGMMALGLGAHIAGMLGLTVSGIANSAALSGTQEEARAHIKSLAEQADSHSEAKGAGVSLDAKGLGEAVRDGAQGLARQPIQRRAWSAGPNGP